MKSLRRAKIKYSALNPLTDSGFQEGGMGVRGADLHHPPPTQKKFLSMSGQIKPVDVWANIINMDVTTPSGPLIIAQDLAHYY